MKPLIRKVSQNREIQILSGLFFVSLLIRLLTALWAPIYGDEITWMVRGKELIYALIKLNFNYFPTFWWADTTETQAIAIPLAFINGLSHVFLAGEGKYSLQIFSDIFASRFPLVLINSFFPPIIFYYGAKFFKTKTAFLAAILYAINPVVINIDAWVLNDSFLALFSFLAVVIFFDKLKNQKFSLLPALFFALAILCKPTGILVAIFWFGLYLQNRYPKSFVFVICNFMLGFLFTILFWPGAWFNPVLALPEYFWRQLTLVSVDISVFYFGHITNDPGWSYYFFQFLIKMPEVIIFGLITYLIIQMTKFKRKIIPELWLVFGYIVAYLLILIFSANKLGLRYALPVFPWLFLFSAEGLLILNEKIKSQKFKFFISVIGFISLIYPLSYFPNFDLYYNFFIGGPKNAQNYDMVGWCTSTKPAFEYLNSIRFQGVIYVAGCQTSAEYATKIPLTRDLAQADTVVLETYFRKQRPEREVFKILEGKTPFKIIESHGADIAEIYLIN